MDPEKAWEAVIRLVGALGKGAPAREAEAKAMWLEAFDEPKSWAQEDEEKP